VPTTPNPTSGFLLLVPSDEVIPLEMSVSDGMKLIISGGAVAPPYETNDPVEKERLDSLVLPPGEVPGPEAAFGEGGEPHPSLDAKSSRPSP